MMLVTLNKYLCGALVATVLAGDVISYQAGYFRGMHRAYYECEKMLKEATDEVTKRLEEEKKDE